MTRMLPVQGTYAQFSTWDSFLSKPSQRSPSLCPILVIGRYPQDVSDLPEET